MVKFLRLKSLLCCTFWICCLTLTAQDDTCIRFEELPADAVYGKDAGQSPGDLAFSLKGVNAYLREFLYSDTSEPGFWNVSVTASLFGDQPALDGQSLFISNINLQFDFTGLERAVNGLCFRIVDGGGEENIAVNGQPLKIIPDFSDVPVEIAPGVLLSVNTLPGTNDQALFNAEVCLRGKIETLTIGGQEFALDNLCFYHEPCTLTDLKAEIVNCHYVNDEVYVYDMAVDFPVSSTTDAHFDLFIDGTFRGYYSVADLPLSLKEIRVLSSKDVFEVKVCANDRPDCCVSVELPNQGCPVDCSIEKVEIGGIECSFDGFYYAKILTAGTNLSGAITITNEQGETWSGPADGSELVKFPIPDQNYDQWTVCDPQYPNCCYTFDFDVPCPTCRIGPLQAEASECTDDGMFFIKLDFEHFTPTGQFYVFINGEQHSAHAHSNLPLRLGPFPADGATGYKVLVRDASELCDQDIYLEPVTCPPYNCVIGDLKLSEPICAENGQFYFELNFEHANTSDKFQVLLNQEVFESYSYQDLPVKVGPLPANTDKDWQVLVRDLSASNTTPCASDAKLGAVHCPGGACMIGALKLLETYCTEDGQEFYTHLDFEYKNTSEKFQLYLNDELYGTFAYQELPLKLGPFNALIDLEWKLLVKDASGVCAEDIHFSAPNCGVGNCNLSNLQVERYPCIGGQFLVDLFFDIKNPGPQGYYVFTNGQISGPYSYDHSYITLGPFPGDGATVYDFLVIDIADPSCYDYFELGPVDCSHPCTISEVKAEAHACNDNGGFLVDFSFTYDKVGNSGFTVRGNGHEYGQFEYGKDFYTIGPLAGDGSTTYELVIIDNENPDCRNFTTIGPIDCLPCEIGELEYTVQCREERKEFLLNLDFDYKNPDSESFVLAIGDAVIGKFPYTELPLSREIALPENGKLNVAVWDSENESCAQKAAFSIPCCYLSEPVVEAYPCANDGELWVELDLDYYNVSETFQLVYGPVGGDLAIREFAYTDLPVTLGPLPGQTASDWYFEVTDLGFFCQSDVHFSSEYCDNDACAEWDQTNQGAYGPLTGFDPGDPIDEEDGLRLSFAPANSPDCDCAVFITKASTFPAFQAASGQVVLLDNSGALLSAPGYEFTSLVVDFYYSGNEALLKINGEEIVAAAHPRDFPATIAPGVELKVEITSDDGRNGRMIFSGKIYRLSLLSRGKWVLDNFCTEKKEKEDKVWPGDTNLDNIANHIDLLNIGLGFGEQGPPRPEATIIWEAQQATDWPGLFYDNDLNYKHADANGSGRIDREDRIPILEHYGLTHGPLPVFSEIPATENDPPLYVDFETSSSPIPPGGTFQVPVVFGTEALPVEDIYGIAFTISFDPEVINPASIEVVYPDSWLGDTEQNLLTLDRTLAESGRINVALTRIDQLNVGGFGPIASLIGAIDDIAGKETQVGITEVVAIRVNEDRIPVNNKISLVEFSEQLDPEIGYIDLNASLNIFPNPTSSEVLITSRFNFPIEKIRVLDGYGNPTGLQVTGKNRINLDELPSGVYMLRIQLGEYTISRKVVKVN